MRQYLGSLHPCIIGPNLICWQCFFKENNSSKMVISPKAWSVSEVAKVSNIYLPASKFDI